MLVSLPVLTSNNLRRFRLPDSLFFINEAAAEFGDSIAIKNATYSLSYKQLTRAVQSVSNTLSDHALPKSKPVAIISENSIEFIIFLLACWYNNITTAPLSFRDPVRAAQVKLEQLGTDTLFVSEEYELPFNALKSNTLVTIDNFETIPDEPVSLPRITMPQELTVIFTSGSTGDPKGVVHTFANHYYNALGSNENISLEPGDRWLLSLPLFHVGGLAILFRSFLSGTTVVLPDRTLPLSEQIARDNISHVSVVPAQLRTILQHPDNLQSLRAILIGGAPVSSDLIEQAVNLKLPLYTSYGLSEMASQVTTTKPGAVSEELHTSGKLLPYRQLNIPDNEILVKGETLFKRYLHDSNPYAHNGWFHTGDVGEFDENSNLIVHGRKDNMFISGGENIYPEEIEHLVTEYYKTEQVIVVPVPDEEYGNRPVLFLDKTITENDKENLHTYLLQFIPKYKLPVHIYHWPENITSTGIKVSRTEFMRLAEKLVWNH